MKNKNARKRLPFPIPVWFQVLAASAYALASFVYNYLKHGFTDLLGSLVVSACLVGLFYLFAYHIRCLFNPVKRAKALWYAVVLYALLPLLCWGAVYEVLPWFGIMLYDPAVPFRMEEFIANTFGMVSRLSSALALYTLYYLIRLATKRYGELLLTEWQTQQEKAQIRANLLLSVLQSHHLKNALQEVVNKAEELGDDYIPALVPRLADVWDYAVQTLQAEKPIVPIEYEQQTLDHMVATIRLKHDDDGVIQLTSVGKPSGQYIAPLALVTPLENAVMHGFVDTEHPIRISQEFGSGFFRFTCVNHLHPKARPAASSGKGLLLLQQCLLMMPNCRPSLEYDSSEDTFTLCLTIKFDT